jgi:hypothetical protein
MPTAIRDIHAALAEMRRMFRLGGHLRFVERGRAPEPSVACWQKRLDPIRPNLRAAGGKFVRSAPSPDHVLAAAVKDQGREPRALLRTKED